MPTLMYGDLERLARDHIAAENRRDLDAIMSTVAEDGLDYQIVSSGERFTTREGVRGFYARFAAAVPNVQVTVNELMVDVERRRVTVEFTFSGRLEKPLWGLAPYRKPLRVDGAVLYEFNSEGKVVREITYLDQTEVLSSMGLIANTRTEFGRTLLLLQSPLYLLKCGWYKLFG
jgi:steroid delta-isomerase-like uncharacterized protein